MEMTFAGHITDEGSETVIVKPPCRGFYTDFRIWIYVLSTAPAYLYLSTKNVLQQQILPVASGDVITFSKKDGIFMDLTDLTDAQGSKIVYTAFSKRKLYVNNPLTDLLKVHTQPDSVAWVFIQATFVPKMGEAINVTRYHTYAGGGDLAMTDERMIPILNNGIMSSLVFKGQIPKSATNGVVRLQPYLIKSTDKVTLQNLSGGTLVGDIMSDVPPTTGLLAGRQIPFKEFKVDAIESTDVELHFDVAGVKVQTGDFWVIDISVPDGTFSSGKFVYLATFITTKDKTQQVKKEYITVHAVDANDELIVDLGLI